MGKTTWFALVAFAVIGCGPRRYLAWEGSPPAPALTGRVSVEVADRREPKRGGEDPSVIGIQRSGWGIPYPLRIGGPAELTLEMHDLFAEAALSTGIGVLPFGQSAGATSRLAVEIQSFWCDGYFPVYKAHAVASAVIVDGATNQVRVPGQPLTAEGQAGDCRHALRRTMSSLYSSARGWFATPQIHAALVGEPLPPGPPPSSPPPPPPAAP
jgi:hypothetical protein